MLNLASKICSSGAVRSDFRIFSKSSFDGKRNKSVASFLRNVFNIRSAMKIGTHSGVFHSDEVLGCFMLRILHENAEIIRSRDPEELEKCDIVIDVGGVYDLSMRRFDHHQREFIHTMNSISGNRYPWKIKLSSAGLVYYHYGKEIIAKILNSTDEKLVEFTYANTYESFVREIDAIDNGVPMFKEQPLYTINTDLSSRVKLLNPVWNESDPDFDAGFHKALAMVGEEFVSSVRYAGENIYPLKRIVHQAIKNRFNVHPSGEIIELVRGCPWKEHFYSEEFEMGLEGVIKFVLFPGNDNYRVQVVSVSKGSFVERKSLDRAWWGLRDAQLCEVSGIEGCVFAHANGFIGGNKTREGALQMAIKSLEASA